MTDQVQLTKQGYDSLKEELRILLDEKRPKLVDRIANARSQGDLAENSDYQNARDELEFLDGRIEELQDVLKNVMVIAGGKGGNVVSIGTRVKVQINGNQQIFEIVGEWEADPGEKKISHSSPLGQALIGKVVGDSFEVEAPAGKLTYKVLSID
ncbi:MAG TPA: transcription elongation factor GreA [Patescibacteria group bacterium]|nr:transcription elongation factor GreA [Patescibacteria group bacterium]